LRRAGRLARCGGRRYERKQEIPFEVILLNASFEKPGSQTRGTHGSMQHFGIPLDPDQAAAERGLLCRDFLRVQNRALGNIDVIAKLRVEVKPDRILFRRSAQIPDQQQRIGRLVRVSDYFGNKVIQPKASAGDRSFFLVRHRALPEVNFRMVTRARRKQRFRAHRVQGPVS
jgi:hypothetical protein